MAGSSKKVIFAALVGNALIAVTKFGAAVVTGSSAMFSEGVHSLVDTGNQVLLLYGLRRSQAPPDEDFPFGHGKELYFWSFIVALLIFALGAGISIYEGVSHLLHPEPIENVGVSYVVLFLAIIFEGGAWFLAWREFSRVKGGFGYVEAVQRGKDPSLFVVLFEDSAAMLGLLVALAGIGLGQLTGNVYFDGIASILIGLILAATAVWLAYETQSLLIGESANREVVQKVRTLVSKDERVVHVNEVLSMHMGPEFILLNLSVDFRNSLTAAELEGAIQDLTETIKAELPRVKRIFVEAEERRRPQVALREPPS